METPEEEEDQRSLADLAGETQENEIDSMVQYDLMVTPRPERCWSLRPSRGMLLLMAAKNSKTGGHRVH